MPGCAAKKLPRLASTPQQGGSPIRRSRSENVRLNSPVREVSNTHLFHPLSYVGISYLIPTNSKYRSLLALVKRIVPDARRLPWVEAHLVDGFLLPILKLTVVKPRTAWFGASPF